MFVQVNDVCYHVERAGSGIPLLFLHGFTGSTVSWDSYIARFHQEFLTVAIDFLGHGKSDAPTDPTRYEMEWCVQDLNSILDTLGISRANVLGYSMGGRVALHFAHTHPERVNALILESATPGIKNGAEREERIASDAQLADKIEREGIEPFVEYWTNIPLFATQACLSEAKRENLKKQRLQNIATGLANSLRGLSVGKQKSLWQHLNTIQIPTLLLTGALDEKFTSIAREVCPALPNAQLEIVSEAGHTIHLEQPERFQELVLEFLTETGD